MTSKGSTVKGWEREIIVITIHHARQHTPCRLSFLRIWLWIVVINFDDFCSHFNCSVCNSSTQVQPFVKFLMLFVTTFMLLLVFFSDLEEEKKSLFNCFVRNLWLKENYSNHAPCNHSTSTVDALIFISYVCIIFISYVFYVYLLIQSRNGLLWMQKVRSRLSMVSSYNQPEIGESEILSASPFWFLHLHIWIMWNNVNLCYDQFVFGWPANWVFHMLKTLLLWLWWTQ